MCVIGSLDHWLDHPQRLIPRLAKYASVCLWVSSRDCGITHGGENRRWAYVAGGGLWAGGGGGTCPGNCPAWPLLYSSLLRWESSFSNSGPATVTLSPSTQGQPWTNSTNTWTKTSPPPLGLGDIFCHTDETSTLRPWKTCLPSDPGNRLLHPT